MTWTHPAYEDLARRLSMRIGLTFAPERCADAELKIRRAMIRAGVSDPARYDALIQTDRAALDDLIAELTIGETYFFREPAQFQFLRETVLPKVRRRRGEGHFFRAWSAGCSSGEEAYSLAIVLAEEGLAPHGLVLATDISREALAKARRASYGAWSLRGEAAAAALHHLHRDGDRFVVNEPIRRLVVIEHHNLARDDYPSVATKTQEMDLILCRNTLIYFDKETVRAVARRLYAALADGGWLLTASTDPSLADLAPLETVVTEQGIFYRRSVTSASRRCDPTVGAGAVWSPGVAPPAGGEASGRDELRAALESGPRRGPEPPELAEVLAAAREDLARGEYARAAERTRDLTAVASACVVHVRALANLDDLAGAERACGRATARHPLCPELHYLRAVLLVGLGRDEEAAQEARRVTCLDRSLAIAHFTLGSILRRLGDEPGARRAFRNARDLCAARPADEVVPLSDGQYAGRLAEAARAQVARRGDDTEAWR